MQNDTMNMISDPFTNCIIPFLVSKASILAKSGFNLATFIEEVRAVMGVPDWFLYLDSRRTRRVHSNKCVQIRIHFAGPQANRLEQDFNTLLRTGKLPQPSIYIPGKKNIQNLIPASPVLSSNICFSRLRPPARSQDLPRVPRVRLGEGPDRAQVLQQAQGPLQDHHQGSRSGVRSGKEHFHAHPRPLRRRPIPMAQMIRLFKSEQMQT